MSNNNSLEELQQLKEKIVFYEEAVEYLDCENDFLTHKCEEVEGVYAQLWYEHQALLQQINLSSKTKLELDNDDKKLDQKSTSPEFNFFAHDENEVKEDKLNEAKITTTDGFPEPSVYFDTQVTHMQPPNMMQAPLMSFLCGGLPTLFPFGSPPRTGMYSSELSADLTELPNFVRSVLQLPGKGIHTAQNLQPLRGRLLDYEDPKEYFRQFMPYILEEVRSQICQQLKVIAKKKRLAFPITLKSQKSCNEGDALEMELTFSAKKRDLPKLEHGFFNEAVLIVSERKGANKGEKLVEKLAIATVKPNYDDDDKVDIKLTLPRCSSFPAHPPNKKVVWLHWLCGLTPSERMFDVCRNMPTCSFQRQFIAAKLEDWPEISKQSFPSKALPTELQRLNQIQASIVERLRADESGLKLLVGPPGTGKTTTAVCWLMQYVNQHPDQRILICTPSNQALHVLLHEAIKNLSPDTAVALTGIAKSLPNNLRRVYVHGVAEDFLKPLIQLKRELCNRPVGKTDEANAWLIVQGDKILDILSHVECELIKNSRMSVKGNIQSHIDSMLSKLQTSKEALRQHSNEEKNPQALCNSFIEITEAAINLIKENSSYLESYLTQRAQIVFATLVSSGRKWLKKQIDHFNVVLLDEAAQALVPEALIPLTFAPDLYIQIGDPDQLPATITSQAAQNKHYEKSMMHWLIKEYNQPHEKLKIQYRMHQDICRWVSNKYYNGELITADSIASRPSILQQNTDLVPELRRPSLFFNIDGEENRRDGSDLTSSCYNETEAQAVISMARYLVLKCKFAPSQIGIITFYSEQLRTLDKYLNKAFRNKKKSYGIDVNTVDGFQGGEKDIILVSVVRTSESVGFLKDWRRINVAMSRAKHARWVFGKFEPLNISDSDMPSFLSDCIENRAVLSQETFSSLVRHQKFT